MLANGPIAVWEKLTAVVAVLKKSTAEDLELIKGMDKLQYKQ